MTHLTPKVIENLIAFIKDNEEYTNHNRIIFEILEGFLLDKIKNNLRNLLISDRAFAAASKLIPPINLLRQVNTKLSTIYNQPPKRTAKEPGDQDLLDYYEQFADVNTAFNEANKFFNGQKVAALEPFIDEKKPFIRAMSGHQFLPHSSNLNMPTRVTEMIKFIGKRDDKNIFFIYTGHEFTAVNEDGIVQKDFLVDNGGVNDFGLIPITYIKRSRTLLIPLIDTDTIPMSVLIPSMWASLNYAINFQAHSILYGIDLDSENIELNPDSFLVFKSEADKKPEIGSIKPQIDISEVDKHILDLQENFEGSTTEECILVHKTYIRIWELELIRLKLDVDGELHLSLAERR